MSLLSATEEELNEVKNFFCEQPAAFGCEDEFAERALRLRGISNCHTRRWKR